MIPSLLNIPETDSCRMKADSLSIISQRDCLCQLFEFGLNSSLFFGAPFTGQHSCLMIKDEWADALGIVALSRVYSIGRQSATVQPDEGDR